MNVYGGAGMPRRLRDNKVLFYLYQGYKFLVFFPLLGIGWSVLFSVFMALIAAGAYRAASRIPFLWARYSALIIPMTMQVIGIENIDPRQSYVIVANHLSQVDAFVIYGWLPMDFRFVMKKELRNVPVVGPSCFRLGHIYIDRSNHESSVKAINDARKKIRNGTSIFFFPEGHRSDAGLLPFKKGAFKFTVDIGLPLLPMTIVGSGDILPANTTALFPGKAMLVIHKPIPVEGYNDSNIDELMARARDVISGGLEQN
jgi:1-acyl-sn-glycerol-3-phosphate acyltransferase